MNSLTVKGVEVVDSTAEQRYPRSAWVNSFRLTSCADNAQSCNHRGQCGNQCITGNFDSCSWNVIGYQSKRSVGQNTIAIRDKRQKRSFGATLCKPVMPSVGKIPVVG